MATPGSRSVQAYRVEGATSSPRATGARGWWGDRSGAGRPAIPGDGGAWRASAVEHLAEDVLQDAAVAGVIGLGGGVDPDVGVELNAGVGADLDCAGDVAVVQGRHAGDGERLGAGKAQAF